MFHLSHLLSLSILYHVYAWKSSLFHKKMACLCDLFDFCCGVASERLGTSKPEGECGCEISAKIASLQQKKIRVTR